MEIEILKKINNDIRKINNKDKKLNEVDKVYYIGLKEKELNIISINKDKNLLTKIKPIKSLNKALKIIEKYGDEILQLV